MAENVSHFAVKSIGLSRVKERKPQTLMDAARHNLREIQAEQGAAAHIDARRSHLNQVLAGPCSAAEIQSFAIACWTDAGLDAAGPRYDCCQAIEVVVSLPPGSPIEPESYFASAFKWLKEVLPLPVLSAVVHHDESTVHMHVLLLPLMNGKRIGSSLIERAELKRLREGFFSVVAGPAGLQRQAAKLYGTVKKWAIEAVMRECQRQEIPEKCGRLWPVFMAEIKRNPLEALKALDISVDSIRPSCDAPPDVPIDNPIGIEDNPIGIDAKVLQSQSLSCVGVATQEEINDGEDCCRAIIHAPQNTAVNIGPASWERRDSRFLRVDEADVTRVRDEFAQDVGAWDDL